MGAHTLTHHVRGCREGPLKAEGATDRLVDLYHDVRHHFAWSRCEGLQLHELTLSRVAVGGRVRVRSGRHIPDQRLDAEQLWSPFNSPDAWNHRCHHGQHWGDDRWHRLKCRPRLQQLPQFWHFGSSGYSDTRPDESYPGYFP